MGQYDSGVSTSNDCTIVQELRGEDNIEELPLWTPSLAHIDTRNIGCKIPTEKAIKQARYN
jgi:hypothetical protein